MKKLKAKTLVVLGIALSLLMIFVLAYTTWKALFYFESVRYGGLLSRELFLGARLGNTEIVDSTLFSEGKFRFQSFDYFPKTFLKQLGSSGRQGDIRCEAMTDIHSLFSYSASVKCLLAGREIHYYFDKSHDFPIILMSLVGLAMAAVAGVFKFFIYVDRLQDWNLQKTIALQKEQLLVEVGAKLVHDLKKGVMTQLNTLHQEFGDDLEMEMIQPDFAERLKAKLKNHFRHVDFLNKYISLLTANLKREKEAHWILLDEVRLKEYLTLVFPTRDFRETRNSAEEEGVKFVYSPADARSEFRLNGEFKGFQVPEMSFFRILKNVSENFNAYGKGDLSIEIFADRQNGEITLKTANEANENVKETPDSTNLGHIIIRQLLSDNFGDRSKLTIRQDKGVFSLEMNFPLVAGDA